MLELTISRAAPLVLAAMGGYTSERSGVINIALEGKMLSAACAAAVLTPRFGPWGGLAGGILVAVVLSILHWLATQHYRIDHVVSGMAINALAIGGTNFANAKFADAGRSAQAAHLPLIMFYAIALIAPIGVWAHAKYTRGGLRMVAVGSDPDKSRLVGLQPVFIRLKGQVATGVFTGLAGVLLFTETGVFSDNMTAGQGYIALAALILSGWRPMWALVAGLTFGFFSALQLKLQGTDFFGSSIPSEAWSALPHIVTIIALAGFAGRNRTPSGLGKP